MGRQKLWALLALLLRLHVSEARTKVKTIKLGVASKKEAYRWNFVGKFGYAVGVGTYAFRAKVHRPRSLLTDSRISIETYLDEDWPRVESTDDHCNRSQFAKRLRPMQIGPVGEWGPWVNGTTRQTVRAHLWYFAVSDCNFSLVNHTYTLHVEFLAKQEDGSHFSVEQRWMLCSNLAVLLGFTAFMLFFSRKCRAFSSSAGAVHPVIWALVCVMLTQYVAQTLHSGHLVAYRSNGIGVPAMEVLSEILFMLSQIMQSALLITIALGYTLLQSEIGDLDIVIPTCFMIALVHILLVCIGKLQDDSSNKFHDHEGLVGWILLVLRLSLYAWFMWAIQSTAAAGGLRLQSFLRHFKIAGSLYFLAYPVLFLAVGIFAPYLRAPIMASGQMTMQMASNVWLSSLFLLRGDYFKVSSLSDSILPCGSPTSRMVKAD